MAKRIAQLIVDIEANTASLNKGFQDARQSVDRFGSQVKTAMKAIASSFVIREIGQFVKQQIDVADNFAKLSQKTGIATETLSAYAHGARLAGVSSEQLATGLGRLARGMLDASAGSKEQLQAFKALGVEVRESGGGLRSLEDVLGDVAQQFSLMADGTTKSALAQRIFGRAGAELIPFLNQGRAGMEATRKEAERLGIVISTDFAKQAEQFNDNLTRMKSRLEGLAITMAGPVVNATNDMFDALEGRLTAFQNKAALFNSPLFQLLKQVLPLGGLVFGQIEKRAPEVGIQRTPAESAAASMDAMFAAGRVALQRARQDAALLNSELRDKAAELFKKQLEGAAAALRDARMSLTLATMGPGGVFGMGRTMPAPPDLKNLGPGIFGPGSFPTASSEESGFKTRLRDLGAEAAEVFERVNQGVLKVKTSFGQLNPMWEEMKGHLKDISQAGLQGVGDALLGLTSWRQLARQVIADLGDMLWYLLVVKPLMGAFFSGSGGAGAPGTGGGGFGFSAIFGGLGSLAGLIGPGGTAVFNPNREFGGPVLPGRSYLVGEGGTPERLTMFPGGGGMVTPLGGGAGGGKGDVHITINNPEMASRLQQMMIVREIADAVAQARIAQTREYALRSL